MKSSNELLLKDAIDQVLKGLNMKSKLNQVRLINSWEQFVGTTISKYTSALYLDGSKLILKVENAPLRHELGYLKQDLIEKLNAELGEEVITEIIVR